MNGNWKKYNKTPVRRGEIMPSFDAVEQWGAEPKGTNRGKEGRRHACPESFMEALGCYHPYLHLPFGQTEGLIKSHLKGKSKTPTHSAIWKRANRSHAKTNPKPGKDVVAATDGSGVRVADGGERMRQKWQKRRGFLKIHAAADVRSKRIAGSDIADDKSHGSESFVSPVEQSK